MVGLMVVNNKLAVIIMLTHRTHAPVYIPLLLQVGIFLSKINQINLTYKGLYIYALTLL